MAKIKPIPFAYTTNFRVSASNTKSASPMENPMGEALLAIRNNFSVLRNYGFTVQKNCSKRIATHYVITNNGKVKIKYHGLLSLLRSITKRERKDLRLIQKEVKTLGRFPILVGYKHKINKFNFPSKEIQSSDEISKRLSLFNQIKLNNEAIIVFKNQINKYKRVTANQSSGDMAADGAILTAMKNESFDKNAILAIKALRHYCQTEGENSPGYGIDTSPLVLKSDFKSLGNSIALGIVTKMMMDKHTMSTTKELDILIKNDYQINMAMLDKLKEMTDWIEEDEKELSPELQQYLQRTVGLY